MLQPLMLKKLKLTSSNKDLQDLLEIIPPTPQKRLPFITGDWNAKAGSQEIPEVIGKFGLGMRNEAGQRLIDVHVCSGSFYDITSTFSSPKLLTFCYLGHESTETAH